MSLTRKVWPSCVFQLNINSCISFSVYYKNVLSSKHCELHALWDFCPQIKPRYLVLYNANSPDPHRTFFVFTIFVYRLNMNQRPLCSYTANLTNSIRCLRISTQEETTEVTANIFKIIGMDKTKVYIFYQMGRHICGFMEE